MKVRASASPRVTFSIHCVDARVPKVGCALAKILHVIGTLNPEYGGPVHRTVEMCVQLASSGHQVTLLAPDNDLTPVTQGLTRSHLEKNSVDLVLTKTTFPS